MSNEFYEAGTWVLVVVLITGIAAILIPLIK